MSRQPDAMTSSSAAMMGSFPSTAVFVGGVCGGVGHEGQCPSIVRQTCAVSCITSAIVYCADTTFAVTACGRLCTFRNGAHSMSSFLSVRVTLCLTMPYGICVGEGNCRPLSHSMMRFRRGAGRREPTVSLCWSVGRHPRRRLRWRGVPTISR